MVTIKDVANKAGVSTATVSRVLRNIGYISQETYEIVHKTVNELGYVANATAQQLKTNPSNSVGFIISDASNEYYFSILPEIQKMLYARGFNLIIVFSSEDPVHEAESFHTLIASRVSTILFTPVCNTNIDVLNLAKKNGIKIVQLFRDIYPEYSAIINDDEYGCFKATEKLINENCKRIMLVDVAYEHMEFTKVKPSRSAGFRKALKDNKDVQSKIIYFPLINYDTENLKESIKEFNPDGIITATNIFGLEAMSLIKNRDDIKLITFDDNKWLTLYNVTAIKQNIKELTQQIENFIYNTDDSLKKVKVTQELIIR